MTIGPAIESMSAESLAELDRLLSLSEAANMAYADGMVGPDAWSEANERLAPLISAVILRGSRRNQQQATGGWL